VWASRSWRLAWRVPKRRSAMRRWDAKAAEWHAANYDEYATNRLAVASVAIPPGAVVVDIGCGTGYALRLVASKVADATLIGIDPVPRMLELARERLAKSGLAACVELRLGEAAAIPVDHDRADLILAFDTFDYWPEPDAGIAEIVRVLSPGGRLVALKDAGDANAASSRRAFLAAISASPLRLLEERELREGEVGCTRWVCGLG